ncbi:hypothetical protein JW960_08975 [candidate division KSB1 bacterium]|nr:hypothetical protein [candidate division KSB1 bacterium]
MAVSLILVKLSQMFLTLFLHRQHAIYSIQSIFIIACLLPFPRYGRSVEKNSPSSSKPRIIRRDVDFMELSTDRLRSRFCGKRMLLKSQYDKPIVGYCTDINQEYLVTENASENTYTPLPQIKSMLVVEDQNRMPYWLEGCAVTGTMFGLIMSHQHESRGADPWDAQQHNHNIGSFLLNTGLGCLAGSLIGYFTKDHFVEHQYVEYRIRKNDPLLQTISFDPDKLLARWEQLGAKIADRKQVLRNLLRKSRIVMIHPQIGVSIDLKEHLDYHLYPDIYDFIEAYMLEINNENGDNRSYFSLVLRENGDIAVLQHAAPDLSWMRTKVHESMTTRLAH